MAKKKKKNKKITEGGYEQGEFLEGFVGIWRTMDANGDYWNQVRLVGPGEQGLPDKIIALGMVAHALDEVKRYYEEIVCEGHNEE